MVEPPPGERSPADPGRPAGGTWFAGRRAACRHCSGLPGVEAAVDRLRMRLLPLSNLPLLATACALAFGPATGRADVEERIEYRTSDVPAAAAAVVVYRPAVPPATALRPAAASTAWQVDWTLSSQRLADGSCVAARVLTRLAVSITLPSEAPASPDVGLLRRHEEGHLQIAQLAAGRLDAELQALAPMADCRALQAEAARRAAARLERLHQAQAAYDGLTDSGRRPHGGQTAISP